MIITDLTPYRKYVDQFDLTEEQKLEWANAVLMLVESIFDMHMGTVQMPVKHREIDSQTSCGTVENEMNNGEER